MSGYWYFTDLPFLDFPTVFNSRYLRKEEEQDVTLGEEYERWPRNVDHKQPAGLTGDHVCGTPDDFMGLAPWPYTGPPVEYDDEHIPLCCGRGRAGHVAGGARPEAIVQLYGPQLGRATSAARPMAEVHLTVSQLGRATSAARPEAVVLVEGPQLGRATSAARPEAVVLVEGPQLGRATSAARPEAEVQLIRGPGLMCSTALRLNPGNWLDWTRLGGIPNWFKFVREDAGDYKVTLTITEGTTTTIFDDGGCDHPHFVGETVGEWCWPIATPVGGTTWFLLTGPNPAPLVYRIEAFAGLCGG